MFEIEKIYGPGDRISLTRSAYTICQQLWPVTHVTLANQRKGRQNWNDRDYNCDRYT